MTEIITAIATATGVLLAFVIHRADARRASQEYHDALWTQILQVSAEKPKLCDLSITLNYLRVMDWDERLSYDAFCLQGWTILHDAAERRLVRQTRMQLGLEWMIAFHSEWLKNNAHLFPSHRFWKVINITEERESRILRHRPVPSTDGLTNWDELHARYFDTIFSPFDPMMPQPTLLEQRVSECIESMPSKTRLRVLDLACGTGHAIDMLARLQPKFSQIEYIGIDWADSACRMAQDRAKSAPFPAQIIQADITEMEQDFNSDIVLCISILETTRARNQEFLSVVGRYTARPHGRAIMILPAYEVIEYLSSLRWSDYKTREGQVQADRALHALHRFKQPDPIEASYSDDGATKQCFHSLDTIARELPEASLEPIRSPEKLEYPWMLARKFDYGYFPEHSPVWDWLVVCKRREDEA